MKKLFLSSLFMFVLLHAENNTTVEHNSSTEKKMQKESNQTASKAELEAKQVAAQMKLEEKYAKEQSFAQGDDYDLKAVEINEESLKNVPVIEPDYDFDITDVYRDDI